MTTFEDRDKEFLGKGLAFPLQVNPRGEITLTSGVRDIEQAIMIILGTAPGERVMRPEFGCRAHELVFAPRNGATEAQMIDYVAQALGRWEPRINIRNIKVTPDLDNDGVLLVEIFFEIKTTHDQRSIVYPFYIAGDEG